jgi:hypothetical protein
MSILLKESEKNFLLEKNLKYSFPFTICPSMDSAENARSALLHYCATALTGSGPGPANCIRRFN